MIERDREQKKVIIKNCNSVRYILNFICYKGLLL